MDAIGPLLSNTTVSSSPAASARAAKSDGLSFGEAIKQALSQVSEVQTNSVELARQFQLGNESVSLEETMIAAQKASVGFQAALQVRNRVVQAYSEIMNMNV